MSCYYKNLSTVWLLAIALMLPIVFPKASFALPLVAENDAVSVGGNILTIYPDHRDKRKVYFMPNSTKFVMTNDGSLPMFGMTTWGLLGSESLEKDQGGYMSFILKLTADSEQSKALKDYIKNSGKGLAVLPVKSSAIKLTNSSGKTPPLNSLFKEFNFSKGGRAEDHMGVTALLTGLGARVMRAQIKNPSAMKIDYCYSFEGLGPNFDAKITVNWNRVYHYFKAQVSWKGFWNKGSVGHETKKLIDDKTIDIQINCGNAKDEEYVYVMADKIVARIFQPELDLSSSLSGPPGGWSFSTLEIKNIDVKELKSETWSLTRRKLVEREFCVPLAIGQLGPYYNKIVQSID